MLWVHLLQWAQHGGILFCIGPLSRDCLSALARYKGKVFLLFLAQYEEKFFLRWLEHGLSIEECYSALAPCQGNVFLRRLSIRGKSFCFFLALYKEKFFLHWLIRGKSFCIDSVYGESHLN
jgi:hypothetical protein